MKACYIDDSEGDCWLFECYSKQLGLDLVVFSSIDQVSGSFDVIFTDLNMPGKHKGIVVLEELQKYDCPIVAVSGLGADYENDQAYMASGYLLDYIGKKELSPARIQKSIKKVVTNNQKDIEKL